MLSILLLSCFALGRRGCRQCYGTHEVSFSAPGVKENAMAFMRNSIINCATGGDYDMLTIRGEECETLCRTFNSQLQCVEPGALACKRWVANLKVWRYCGNGGSLVFNRAPHTWAGLTSYEDTLDLTCYASVYCIGKCNCDHCGC